MRRLTFGATHGAVLRTVTLPYLKPALIGAAAIAFLMSFENFNTTLMLVGSDPPLTVMMYGRMREGASPVLNAVACENTLPGSTAWDSSSPDSSALQGFSTDISVNHGSDVGFKVDTTLTYTINIYRGCSHACSIGLLLRPSHPHVPRLQRPRGLRAADRGQGQCA